MFSLLTFRRLVVIMKRGTVYSNGERPKEKRDGLHERVVPVCSCDNSGNSRSVVQEDAPMGLKSSERRTAERSGGRVRGDDSGHHCLRGGEHPHGASSGATVALVCPHP